MPETTPGMQQVLWKQQLGLLLVLLMLFYGAVLRFGLGNVLQTGDIFPVIAECPFFYSPSLQGFMEPPHPQEFSQHWDRGSLCPTLSSSGTSGLGWGGLRLVPAE